MCQQSELRPDGRMSERRHLPVHCERQQQNGKLQVRVPAGVDRQPVRAAFGGHVLRAEPRFLSERRHLLHCLDHNGLRIGPHRPTAHELHSAVRLSGPVLWRAVRAAEHDVHSDR